MFAWCPRRTTTRGRVVTTPPFLVVVLAPSEAESVVESGGTARVTIATATKATAATQTPTIGASRNRYPAPTASAAASATFHTSSQARRAAGSRTVERDPEERGERRLGGDGDPRCTLGAADGTNASPRAMHEHERQAVRDRHRTLRSARDQPELPRLDEEDREQRQRLDPQHRHRAEVLVATDEANSRLGQDAMPTTSSAATSSEASVML